MKVWGLLFGGICWGCGNQAQEVEDHRQEWFSKRPETFVVDICSGGLSIPSCRLSAVSGGKETTARVNVLNEASRDDAVLPDEPMAALFERAARAARSDGDCDFSFDSQYGYVSHYSCSSGEDGDGESVACFKPDTVDLAACPAGQR
jgi:hypothetical protein